MADQESDDWGIKWFKIAFASGHFSIKIETRVLKSEGEGRDSLF